MSGEGEVTQQSASEGQDDPPAVKTSRISLSTSAEYASYLAKTAELCWAVANFKAPFYEPTSRAPVDIVAVIDKSGSMRGSKIELVKKTLLFVIDQLKEGDRISLVTYDTNVELVFGLMKMDKLNKEKAKSFVESIRDGSSTNLCGGLLKGMEQIALTCGGEKAQVQSVLLLTDGLANHWITTKEGIVAEMKKMQDQGLGAVTTAPADAGFGFMQQMQVPNLQNATGNLFMQQMQVPKLQKKKKSAQPAQPKPVLQEATETPVDMDPATKGYKFDGTVYTFGFGSDHDANMLEAISTQGGGVYYFIDSTEKIPESFADCLGGLLSVMGQNLSLQLEAIGDNSFKDVHANRTIKWTTQKKCCEIPMGDLQSEEERDIVLEVDMPALSDVNDAFPVIRVQLSYFNVITSLMDTVECQLTVKRALSNDEKGSGNMTVDVQRNRILTTSVLKQAEVLADNGKLHEAQKVLTDAIAKLEGSLSKDHEFCKGLVVELKKCLENMKTQHSYHSKGKLMVTNRIQAHSVQRSNMVSQDFTSYESSSKANYKMRAKNVK